MSTVNIRRVVDLVIAQLQTGETASVDDAVIEAAGGIETYAELVVRAQLKADRKPVITELREGQLLSNEPMDNGTLHLPFDICIPRYIIVDDEAIPARKATLRQLNNDNKTIDRRIARQAKLLHEREETYKLLHEAADGNDDLTVEEAYAKYAEAAASDPEEDE